MDLQDPGMKEIIDDFCKESNGYLTELEMTLELLEDKPNSPDDLEKFGQVIDRIMGAAKSIGSQEIATFCELGKVIGYKSSQTSDMALLNVVIAVLFDTVDLLKLMIEKLQTGKTKSLDGLNTDAFASRLKWLSEKFKDIERSSCAVSQEAKKKLSQSSIDDLMASLGL